MQYTLCCMLIIQILFYLHSELVRELTIQIQNNENKKAVRTVAIIGKLPHSCSHFQEFYQPPYHHPQSIRKRPVKGQASIVYNRLKAIREVN